MYNIQHTVLLTNVRLLLYKLKIEALTVETVFSCCVLLTGLRGGLDLMNSRMISWALFFNLGGISPFT